MHAIVYIQSDAGNCRSTEANIDPADRGAAGDCDLVGVRTIGEALDVALG